MSVEQQLRAFGLGDEDLGAWRESGLDEAAFVGWLTDRVARKPTGERARRVYGAEDVHDFARIAILDALALTTTDRLLEIGCGGGLLMRDALTGANVTGIDHSEEMVALARERAPGSEVLLASAEQLPFAEGAFTAVAMSVVFFFFDHPDAVLAECRRVLMPDGGRLALFTTAPELRGTPAAPEPLASEGHFYSDDELAGLARTAGLAGVVVTNRDGGQLLVARRRSMGSH